MAWLILTVILGMIGIGGLLYAMFAPPNTGRGAGMVVSFGALLVFCVLTLFMSMHKVGQREVGIVQSFSGTIGNSYKSPGLVLVTPWNHVKTENVGLQKEVFVFDDGHLGSAVSRDQQTVSAVVAVNYQVEPRNVITLYKTVGPNWKTILLDGRVPQAFKETTAQFTSPNITLNRAQLRIKTLARLRTELARYDIRVVDVFISNIGYSKSYENAIEAKVRQQQAALTAQAKVAQVEAEARQTIARAEGDARSIAVRGKALREFPEVLKLEALKRLAPNAQVIYCSTGDCPSFLGSLVTGGGK